MIHTGFSIPAFPDLLFVEGVHAHALLPLNKLIAHAQYIHQQNDARLIFSFSLSDALFLSVGSVSTTSITISWTLAEDVTATSYIISYYNTNCSSDTYDSNTTYNMERRLTELEEGTTYLITVTTTLRNHIIKYNISASTNATG